MTILAASWNRQKKREKKFFPNHFKTEDPYCQSSTMTVNEILEEGLEGRPSKVRGKKEVSETVLLTHVASFSNVIMT